MQDKQSAADVGDNEIKPVPNIGQKSVIAWLLLLLAVACSSYDIAEIERSVVGKSSNDSGLYSRHDNTLIIPLVIKP